MWPPDAIARSSAHSTMAIRSAVKAAAPAPGRRSPVPLERARREGHVAEVGRPGSVGPRERVRVPGRRYVSPAAMLMVNARIAELKKNATTECASDVRRIRFAVIATSAVCAATPMMKLKYRKSQ